MVLQGMLRALGLLALASAEVQTTPDHPALTARFRFLQALSHKAYRTDDRRLLALPENFANGTMALNSKKAPWDPDLPHELTDNYVEQDLLGKGSFGSVYLAEDKRNGNVLVAVKILRHGGKWATPRLCQMDDRLMAWVRESAEECSKIRQIHENDASYPDGARHVVQCLEDGITEALDDKARQKDPLYIVMNYVGRNYKDWWTEEILDNPQVDPAAASLALRTLSRQMMKGLHFLVHQSAAQKWVHHDLKAPNMAVIGGWDPTAPHDNNLVLTLIDLGSAIPESKPEVKEVCSPMFRPPEFAGVGHAPVGWNSPVHSFDSSGAAYTMLTFGISKGENGLPVFMKDAWDKAHIGVERINTLGHIAACVASQKPYGESFQAFFQVYRECLERDGLDRAVREQLQKKFNTVRFGKTDAEKKLALANLFCGKWNTTGLPKMSGQIVSEWLETGFDKALMKMLEMDPRKRPSPEELLKEKWLAEDYQPKRFADPLPSATCQESNEVARQINFDRHIFMPAAMIAATTAVTSCCFGLGLCCHCFGQVPSSGFTAVVVALATLSTASTSLAWFSQAVTIFLSIASFVLVPFVLATGCKAVQGMGGHAVSAAWAPSLLAAGMFFFVVLVAMLWVASPVLTMLKYIDEHMADFLRENQENRLEFTPEPEHVLIARRLVLATFLPVSIGLVAVLFGLWRDHVHRNCRPITRDVTGTEMPESNRAREIA